MSGGTPPDADAKSASRRHRIALRPPISACARLRDADLRLTREGRRLAAEAAHVRTQCAPRYRVLAPRAAGGAGASGVSAYAPGTCVASFHPSTFSASAGTGPGVTPGSGCASE